MIDEFENSFCMFGQEPYQFVFQVEP
jgi:hypothetical protein